MPGITLTIGRNQDNDIVANSSYVSRYHARLLKEGSVFVIEDLNSANKIYVNGRQVQGRQYINFGDTIQLSKHWKLDWSDPTVMRWMRSEQTPPIVRDACADAWGKQEPASVSDGWGVDNKQSAKPEPLPPQQVVVNQAYDPGQMDRAMKASIASSKSYVGPAFLCWLLYYVGFFIIGFIVNIAYLSSANKLKRESGITPSGTGCLSFLLFFHLIPLIFLIILLASIGFSIPALLEKLQGIF